MKTTKYVFLGLFIGCMAFAFVSFIYAKAFHEIKVGKVRTKVTDSGSQSIEFGWGAFTRYYNGSFWELHNWISGYYLGTDHWVNENGNSVSPKVVGAASVGMNEATQTMPVPDKDGITVHKYMRYHPPTITVDGESWEDPFPLEGQEVNPDKIPGTADVLVESWVNTALGVTIHQKVLAWSQKNHDDYIIHDWTLINTGNTDLDSEIELPDQTLDNLYFMRDDRLMPRRNAPGGETWVTYYGARPTDTLRVGYAYPWLPEGTTEDDIGDPRNDGFLQYTAHTGIGMLWADKSAQDHSKDVTQPQMTGQENSETAWNRDEPSTLNKDGIKLLYQTMKEGFKLYNGTPYMSDAYPGTHHGQNMDEAGYKWPKDMPWYNYSIIQFYSYGPYTLAHNDSVRVVWADVVGSMSVPKRWEIGRDWLNENATWNGKNNFPPPLQNNPEIAPTDNDKAKDHWVYSGKDSLFINTAAAQWAVDNNYEVPVPPPPPSIEVNSKPDRIEVGWGKESESAQDFAGYKVYRAQGNPDPTVVDNELIGEWKPIFQCGAGTGVGLTHQFEDTTATRGKAYYYYVAAFDDGTSNPRDFDGTKQSLESGKYLNMTPVAAHLTREPGHSLGDVRVVPNPYNVNATEVQFTGEPNKILFVGLPPECTIKIYTERGDLVQTLAHTDGSGDESWGFNNNTFMISQEGQVVVSGLYIAHVETPDGKSTNVKFIIVR